MDEGQPVCRGARCSKLLLEKEVRWGWLIGGYVGEEQWEVEERMIHRRLKKVDFRIYRDDNGVSKLPGWRCL